MADNPISWFSIHLCGVIPAFQRVMNPIAEELKRRTKQFALDVIRFVRTMRDTDESRTIGRQLLRSGTGVAANYRSACRARSQVEFIARIGIALDEADESALWLGILSESGIDTTAQALESEAGELSAILAASRITAQRRTRNPRLKIED